MAHGTVVSVQAVKSIWRLVTYICACTVSDVYTLWYDYFLLVA